MLAHIFLLLSVQAPAGSHESPSPPLLSRINLSAREGVPASSIRDLCYDADGFLMLGTTGGLSRYDGQMFQHYLAAETPGLNGDRIVSLHTDREGRTWIGQRLGAPSVYQRGEFRSLCGPEDLTFVKQSFEDRSGAVWFAGSRLARFKNDALEFLGAAEGLPDAGIARIAQDRDGAIWLATEAGVFRQTAHRFKEVDARPALWVLTDFEGYIWAHLEDGSLVKCSGPEEPSIDLGDELLEDELPRGHGRRLLAGSRGLISMRAKRDDGSGLVLQRIQVPGQAPGEGGGSIRVINSLLEGPGEDLWAGTALYGLDYLERQYVRLIGMEIEGASPNLFQVHPVDGDRAIVERPGAIESCLVDSAGAIMPLASEAGWDERAVDSAVTDAGVWVACFSGLARLEGRRLVPVERWRGMWGALATDREGAVWMLHEGLIHCVAAGRIAGSASLGDTVEAEGVTIIGEHEGHVIGARRDGIVKLNRRNHSWDTIAPLDGGRVRALRSGPKGELWVSTYGDGLCRLSANGHVDHWDRGDGLPDPFLGWIGPVDAAGNLWLNANTGIVRVSVASLDAVAQGVQQGVEARTFRAPECNGAAGAELSDGVFALPTLEGLVLFDTTVVPPPSAPPIVSVSKAYVDGQALQSGASVSGTAELRFDFSAPIFPTAADARLQTRLIGLEDSWVDVGDSRTARYPGVHPGEYALEVRARTPESSWSVPVRSHPVVIEPFWYDRTWVRALGLGAGCLAIWWMVRKRTQVLARRNRALSFEIEQRELAESHLRTSEERFRRLFHTAPSAILSWAPTGDLLDYNPHARQLFPRLSQSGVQIRLEDCFEDGVLGAAALNRVLLDKTTVSVVAMTRADSEDPKRCRWHLAPTLGDEDEVINVIAVVMDLSRQERDARTMARLRKSLVRAEESERSRIARELHDDLSQRLAALALNAHLIDRGMTESAPDESRRVESLRSEIESIATDVHALSRQLHPTIVDDLGLITALKSECTQRHQLTEIEITLTIGDEVTDPPRETALALFRIAQEAMRNAAKHADASEIAVRLGLAGNHLVLEVVDDGCGMHAEAIGAGGIGVNSMLERARLVAGDLEIESEPGNGTTVVARVPKKPVCDAADDEHHEIFSGTLARRGD